MKKQISFLTPVFHALLLACLVMQMGCSKVTTGTSTGSDSTTGGSTTSGSSSGSSTDSSDTGGEATSGDITDLDSSPCDQVGGIAYSILAVSDDSIIIGCAGAGGGLFTSSDGGASFSQVTESNSGVDSIDGSSTRIYDLELDDDGNILICGGNNNVSDKVFLYRYETEAATYSTLLVKSTITALGGTGFSDCDNVLASGDTIIIDDVSGTQIMTSTNGGTSWTKTTVGQISDLIKSDSTFYGSGGTTSAGPDFYMGTLSSPILTLSTVDASITNLQEARAIATPDGSRLLIAGAYDTETDSDGNAVNPGVWVRYSTDSGTTWTEATITDASDYSFIRAMACPTSTQCFAAGDLYPSSQGGYVIKSEDGGLTWTAVDLGSVPSTVFYSITTFGDAVWIAGDGSSLIHITL